MLSAKSSNPRFAETVSVGKPQARQATSMGNFFAFSLALVGSGDSLIAPIHVCSIVARHGSKFLR